MKFDVCKVVFQSSYFKSRLDPVTLGGVEGGNLKSSKTLRVEGSGMKPGGKNRDKSWRRD